MPVESGPAISNWLANRAHPRQWWVSFLAARSARALATIRALHAGQLWPPVVPTAVLLKSLRGTPGRGANTNRFLRICIVKEEVSVALASRAAQLRRRSGRGSAVDSLVVALAEPHATILTGDKKDLAAIHSRGTEGDEPVNLGRLVGAISGVEIQVHSGGIAGPGSRSHRGPGGGMM